MVNTNNHFRYRRNVGRIFDDFIRKNSLFFYESYKDLILSCSGQIKISYFDKIEWIIASTIEQYDKQDFDLSGSSKLKRRCAYLFSGTSSVGSKSCGPVYKTHLYVFKISAWLIMEALRSVRAYIVYKRSINSSVSKKVLIVVSQKYQYDRVVPLINKMAVDGIESIVLTIFPADIKTDSNLIKYANLNHYRSFVTFVMTLGYLLKYQYCLYKVRASLASKDLNYLEGAVLEDTLLKESFIQWNYDNLAQAIRTRVLACKFVKKENPSLVYSVDGADTTARIFEEVSINNNIKTYCMSFGFQDEYSQYWTRRPESRYGAINSRTASLVKKLTETKYKVDVIGDPSYDEYQCSDKSSGQTLSNAGLTSSDKIILFISFPVTSADLGVSEGQYTSSEYRQMLETLIDAACDTESTLLIKGHPVDNNNILDIISEYCAGDSVKKNRIKIFYDEDVKNLVCISDVVVGVHSTVAFESILLNKQYLLLQWHDIPDALSLIKENVCELSTSESDVSIILDRMLNKKTPLLECNKREHYLKEMYVYPYDKSADRLIAVFKRILLECSV